MLDDLEWARSYSKSCASRFIGAFDQDDLQSAGIVAFIGAAARYDATKNIPFRGFCATRIRGAIIDEVRRWGWEPRSFYQNVHVLDSTTHRLREELNREPTAYEVGLKLGIGEDDVLEMRACTKPAQFFSWDDKFENDGEDSIILAERIPDEAGKTPDGDLLVAEERQELLACIARLPRIQALVIVLHYLKETPLGEVAKLTGLTPSRISQLHHQALDRLKISCRFQR